MSSSKTYILDDLPTDEDALDFTPYVATLADSFGMWADRTDLTSDARRYVRDVRKGYRLDRTRADDDETH